MAEEIVGSGGAAGGASPSAEPVGPQPISVSPAPSIEEARTLPGSPQPDRAAASSPGASGPAGGGQPDFQAQYRTWAEQRDAQWAEYLGKREAEQAAQFKRATDESQKEFYDRMRTLFDPEYAKQKQAPKYITEEAMAAREAALNQRMEQQYAQIMAERQTDALVASYNSDLGKIQARFPDLVAAYESVAPGNFHNTLVALWARDDKGPSAMQIAEGLEKMRQATLATEQKKWLTKKDATQAATQTIVRGGGAASAAPAKPQEKDSGEKGRGRLRAIRFRRGDVEQAG
jgi:hypothetical protein